MIWHISTWKKPRANERHLKQRRLRISPIITRTVEAAWPIGNHSLSFCSSVYSILSSLSQMSQIELREPYSSSLPIVTSAWRKKARFYITRSSAYVSGDLSPRNVSRIRPQSFLQVVQLFLPIKSLSFAA